MPTVSIIIPVYNKEKYIGNTLDSVLAQKYADYEVVIVNDGSTDKSMDIIEKYQQMDSRISVISIPNGGVSNARNTGLKNAKGKWIQFLDGDDVIDKDYLSIAVPMAEKNDADILFSNFKKVDKNMNLQQQVDILYQGMANQQTLAELFMEYQYKNGFFGFISNKLIKKEIIVDAEAAFKENLKLAEDLDFYAQIYPCAESVYFLAGNSFYYLQTETNYINADNTDYYYSQITVHLDIKAWFVKNGFYLQYKDVLDKKVAEYVYYTLYYAKERSENVKDYYKKIIADTTVMECIDTVYFSGFQKLILSSVKNKNYGILEFLLNARYGIRQIYRRIKV